MGLPHAPLDVSVVQVVLPVDELAPTIAFFTGELGFRVDAIFPADQPTVAVLSGHGVTVRLQPGDTASASILRIECRAATWPGGRDHTVVAPNGTVIHLVDASASMIIPPVTQSLVVSRVATESRWGTGRAGMQYRDVIPGRQGGRFIGSHIRIPHDGPVPDYVHFHKVRFQMIYCRRGWVRVVYEDQGEPFVLRPGDCVLQPPEIRHRVLDSGDGLEVIELGCPAEHETLADHMMSLPTSSVEPHRSFGGQRFVRHQAAAASWHPWRSPGFEYRDVGIGAATDGLAGVRVVRAAGADRTSAATHDAEFMFGFVLAGSMTLDCAGHEPFALVADDTFVIPAGMVHSWTSCSATLEVLEVALPEQPGAAG
jgi:mannose-6-phosphate isomerase-like protein (cupin superfamily)